MEEITIEHLKQVILNKHITKWTPESCSVCDYPIHYMITLSKDYCEVKYDAGCNCSDGETIREKYMKSSLEDVKDHIIRLNGEDLVKALKFWSI